MYINKKQTTCNAIFTGDHILLYNQKL